MPTTTAADHGVTDVYVNRSSIGYHREQGLPVPTVAGLAEVFELAFTFHTEEQRDAFAASFPRYCKVRTSHISGVFGGVEGRRPYATVDMRLGTDGRTGRANETAQRRRSKIVEVFAKLGFDPIADVRA